MVNAVAVVAENTWYAIRAAAQLKATWNVPPSSSTLDTTALLAQARGLSSTRGRRWQAEAVGDALATLGDPNADVIEAESTPSRTRARDDGGAELHGAPPRRRRARSGRRRRARASPSAPRPHSPGCSPSRSRSTPRSSAAGSAARSSRTSSARRSRSRRRWDVRSSSPWTREEDFARDQYRRWPRSGCAARSTRRATSPRGTTATARPRSRCSGVRRSPASTARRSTARPRRPAAPTTSTAGSSSTCCTRRRSLLGYWRSVGHSINAFAVERA